MSVAEEHNVYNTILPDRAWEMATSAKPSTSVVMLYAPAAILASRPATIPSICSTR